MVRVSSSAGGFVTVEVKGVAEAIREMNKKGQQILKEKDAKVFQAANFLQQEIQESIIGNRAEIKSVDTGNFANSISLSKEKDMEFSVYTEVEYAKFLEYGTSKMAPRYHFRNSLNRNMPKIVEIIKSK